MLRPIAMTMLLTAIAWVPGTGTAQELEARAYAPNPVGARFLVLAQQRIDGDVLLDAGSPIEDFEISTDASSAGLGVTFPIADRFASVGVFMPWVDAEASGLVNGVPTRVERSGLGDLRMRFTVSLLRDSALDREAFSRAPPDRTLGASFVVVAPTGEYLDQKLVNVGANRWAFKPEIGGLRRFGKWTIDGSIGVWLYTDNDDFLGNRERSQDPLGVLQAHLSYTFAPRLWLGAGGTWYSGGSTTVDGVPDDNRQSNSRAGLTLSVPIGRSQSIKLAWSKGVTARFGGDFEIYGLSWQYFWID